MGTSNKNPGRNVSEPGSYRSPGLLAICLTWLQAGRLKLTTGQPVPNKRRGFPSTPLLGRPSPDMALDFHPADKGILPARMTDALARAGAIVPARPFVPGQIQPASLDLRLDDVAFRVRASFLPGPGTSVPESVADLQRHQINSR